MALLIWILLGVSGAFVVIALAVAVRVGLRTWRALRELARVAGKAVEELAARGEATEKRATEATQGFEKLGAAVERLQVSLAELEALKRAAGEAGATVAAVRSVVPRK